MDLQLNGNQQKIQEDARQFLSADHTLSLAREIEGSDDGFNAEGWLRVNEISRSATSLKSPDVNLLGLCVLAEELGRVAASYPLVTCAGLASTILRSVPDSRLKEELLVRLGTNNEVITVGLIEASGRDERSIPRLQVREAADGCLITGTKILVPYASVASVILISLRGPGDELQIAAIDSNTPGIGTTRHATTGGDPLFSVSFEDVSLKDEQIIARGDMAFSALDAGLEAATVLAMAETVGFCEGIIEMTADYVKTREQFGRPVGSFQAVAHPLADMRIQTDAGRLLALEASWLIDQGADATFEVASAKSFINDAAAQIAISGHRLHGAIGYSNECDLQLFTRRVRASCLANGGTDEQLERAAVALGI